MKMFLARSEQPITQLSLKYHFTIQQEIWFFLAGQTGCDAHYSIKEFHGEPSVQCYYSIKEFYAEPSVQCYALPWL